MRSFYVTTCSASTSNKTYILGGKFRQVVVGLPENSKSGEGEEAAVWPALLWPRVWPCCSLTFLFLAARPNEPTLLPLPPCLSVTPSQASAHPTSAYVGSPTSSIAGALVPCPHLITNGYRPKRRRKSKFRPATHRAPRKL